MYSATQHLKLKIHWNTTENEEWIYFGADEEVNFSLVKKIINTHFKEEGIFFVYDRQNSGLLDNNQDQKIIKEILENKNFFLWNEKLTKVIEFNYIGILRFGQLDKR